MDKPSKILVPLDGSPLATNALDYALVIFPGAEIIVLNVITTLDTHMSEGGILSPDEQRYEEELKHAKRITETAKQRADEHSAPITATIEEGNPADSIIEYLNNHPIDHIVIGSHTRSDLSQILLGSVATTVVTRSSVPVTVVH